MNYKCLPKFVQTDNGSLVSLRSKRFLARFVSGVRLESWDKSKKIYDGGGGGDDWKRLLRRLVLSIKTATDIYSPDR